MKRIVLLASLFTLGLFAACAPTPPNDNSPAPQLIHDPITKQLTVATPSKNVSSKLNCGCPFKLTITEAGDTSIIKYSVPTKDVEQSQHQITVSANPLGLSKGTYTSYLALKTPDAKVAFLYDTLRDTLIVP